MNKTGPLRVPMQQGVKPYVPGERAPTYNYPPNHKETPQIASALDVQIGGSHYKDMPIQPIVYITANKLGFVEGSVVKYVSRWENKGGVADLKKARHLLDVYIENLEKAEAA